MSSQDIATILKKIEDLANNFNAHAEHDKEWKEQMSLQVTDIAIKMEQLTPIRQGWLTIQNLKNFAVFWAGVISPWAIIAGAIGFLIKFLK